MNKSCSLGLVDDREILNESEICYSRFPWGQKTTRSIWEVDEFVFWVWMSLGLVATTHRIHHMVKLTAKATKNVWLEYFLVSF